MTIESAFDNIKKVYNTDMVKLHHIIDMMYKHEKGTAHREDYGMTGVLLVITLFKEGKLRGMTSEERNKIINYIMEEI